MFFGAYARVVGLLAGAHIGGSRSIPTISPQELQPRSPPRAFEHWRFLLPLVRIDEGYIGGFIAMR